MRLIFDNTDTRSLSSKFRKIRLGYFLDFLSKFSLPVTILDVGGTDTYWRNLGYTGSDNVKITIFNLEKPDILTSEFNFMQGDARNMAQFKDGEFDIVFSNSMIEHLRTLDDQMMAAREIARVGKGYFIQTPNYYFPIEPHFLIPFFQFLPLMVKTSMLMHFNLGWIPRQKEKEKACDAVSRIRLLKRRELESMFPEGNMLKEKCFFLTKSFIFYKSP